MPEGPKTPFSETLPNSSEVQLSKQTARGRLHLPVVSRRLLLAAGGSGALLCRTWLCLLTATCWCWAAAVSGCCRSYGEGHTCCGVGCACPHRQRAATAWALVQQWLRELSCAACFLQVPGTLVVCALACCGTLLSRLVLTCASLPYLPTSLPAGRLLLPCAPCCCAACLTRLRGSCRRSRPSRVWCCHRMAATCSPTCRYAGCAG